MSVKLKVIGLNRLLTTIYNQETELSLLVIKLGLTDKQIETLKKNHLAELVEAYAALIRQRLVAVSADGERLSQVICRRFALDGQKRSTLEALGHEMGVSRERVRQLEKKAIRCYKAKDNKEFLEVGLFRIVAQLLPDFQESEVNKLVSVVENRERQKSRASQDNTANKAWSAGKLPFLIQKYDEGMSIPDMVKVLGGDDSTFEICFEKEWQLQAAKAYVEENWSYYWRPVYRSTAEKYLFPETITDFMLENYSGAVIYRWVAYRNNKEQTLYIGSAQKLCPNRLNEHLHHQPDEASQQLQSTFLTYLDHGWQVGLEILSFQPIVIMPDDLSTGYVRHFLEKMLINYYSQIGQPLQNKNSDKA